MIARPEDSREAAFTVNNGGPPSADADLKIQPRLLKREDSAQDGLHSIAQRDPLVGEAVGDGQPVDRQVERGPAGNDDLQVKTRSAKVLDNPPAVDREEATAKSSTLAYWLSLLQSFRDGFVI